MIDAHFHIWRRQDLPWLMGPMQPRIFGPYEAIRRDYPIAEFRAEAEAAGVTRAVYVQANWPPEQAADEAAWVQATAEAHGWPHAIVAYADLTVEDARPALKRLAARSMVRGVRQQLHWHARPEYRFAARPDLCEDPSLQRNVARLADHGWSFDLQVFTPQMAGAAALAAACPQVTFVLQHAGMLEAAEVIPLWREGMKRLAERPNVVVKLSGLGTFLHRCDPDHIAWVTRETLAMFGAERCLWGSNFPIEKLWTDYATLLAAHRAATPAEHHANIFEKTARRVYRLD